MMTVTLTTFSLSLLALAVAMYALYVALRSSDRSLLHRYTALLTLLQEHGALLDSQALAIRNLRARISLKGAREAKAAKAASDETSEVVQANGAMTEDEKDRWQRETNRQLALRNRN